MYKAYDSLIDRAERKARGDRRFTFIIAVLFVLMITIFVFTKFILISVYVDGNSMQPTLKSGNVLFASKTIVAEVGDIIVIDGEKQNENGDGYDWIIKRVIAIGQKDKTTIVRLINGRIWVGESDQTLVPLDEDYLPDGTQTEPIQSINKDRWELGEGEIFYLGDNRSESKDSRSEYGTCDIEQVVGVVPDWALSMRWLSQFLYDIGMFFSRLF